MRPGREADHSTVLVTGLRDGVTTPLCLTLHDVPGENFTFTCTELFEMIVGV